MATRKKVKRTRKHGEDFLDKIAGVKIQLEDGTTQTFHFANEVKLPTDPILLEVEATRAAARLAFWTYQMERARSKAKAQERAWTKLRADAYLLQRRYIDEHTTDMPTEGNIQARLDAHPELIPVKELLDRAWTKYGVLRSLQDALVHRAYLLQRLLARRQQSSDPG